MRCSFSARRVRWRQRSLQNPFRRRPPIEPPHSRQEGPSEPDVRDCAGRSVGASVFGIMLASRCPQGGPARDVLAHGGVDVTPRFSSHRLASRLYVLLKRHIPVSTCPRVRVSTVSKPSSGTHRAHFHEVRAPETCPSCPLCPCVHARLRCSSLALDGLEDVVEGQVQRRRLDCPRLVSEFLGPPCSALDRTAEPHQFGTEMPPRLGWHRSDVKQGCHQCQRRHRRHGQPQFMGDGRAEGDVSGIDLSEKPPARSTPPLHAKPPGVEPVEVVGPCRHESAAATPDREMESHSIRLPPDPPPRVASCEFEHDDRDVGCIQRMSDTRDVRRP